MQKDDGNPSGGERRPESGELLADGGKKEAQARRPRRGTRRTDGPLGKHESKNTKKMIAAQAIDPAKDIAASRERMAREDERAKRAVLAALCQSVDFDLVAAKVGLSRRTLQKRFRSVTGETLKSWTADSSA